MPGTFSVGGILSGLRTADIIQQLMALERRPLQRLQDQRARQQARLDAVQRLRTQLVSLQALVAQFLDRHQIGAKSAITDTPATSPTVLTATAAADAASGSFKVTVTQLATATRVLSSGPVGQAIDPTATLRNAGFRVEPVFGSSSSGTFSINGTSLSIDETTTLDDGSANSVISKINASGAGVTASLIPDADGRAGNRIQLVSDPGEAIQIGSFADTSNLSRVLQLADATVEGYTGASVTSGAVAAGALSTSIVVGGVTVAIDQADASFTAQQNAAFIVDAVNAAAGSPVRAVDNADGTFTLEHKTPGSQQAIDITAAGSGTGLTVGVTRNGTDRVLGTQSLGATAAGKRLADARLSTPITGLDQNGNGKFAINGVEITFSQADSLVTVINRINASNARVTAFYDPVQDRLRLTAQETGGRSIALSDVTGNFLAATGIVGATQTIGQPATFAIEGINGGQPLTSSSNTVTGYIPGVTLQLTGTSATPVTVTVSQDTGVPLGLARTFVQSVNALLDLIAEQTRYAPDGQKASPLAGDSGVRDIERNLRSLLSSPAVGLSGSYRSLADIGLSTGPIGSGARTSYRLVLDEAKLTAALQNNPEAVAAALGGFLGTLGAPSGSGNITAASGTPRAEHESGMYYVKILDANGTAEARFVTTDGRQLMKRTGTLLPGVENTSLIPGVRLTANSALTAGEDSFTLTVSSRGVMVRTGDYLRGLLGTGGFFDNREDFVEALSGQLSKRIDLMEARLERKEEALARKFAALEAALARLTAQNSALLGQIAALGSN